MIVQLREVTKQLWNWKEGKAVVLCGANGNFCSGLDLSLAKKLSGSKVDLRSSRYIIMLRNISTTTI